MQPPRVPRAPKGFTLLEMLVVMVLLGLVTTMALPAMQRWHDAVQTKAQLTGLLDALRGAGFRASALQREQIVDLRSFDPPTATAATADAATQAPGRALTSPDAPVTEPPRPGAGAGTAAAPDRAERVQLSLPPRWKVVTVENVRFLSNGLCRGGGLRLLNERGDPVDIRVNGPMCQVEAATDRESRSP